MSPSIVVVLWAVSAWLALGQPPPTPPSTPVRPGDNPPLQRLRHQIGQATSDQQRPSGPAGVAVPDHVSVCDMLRAINLNHQLQRDAQRQRQLLDNGQRKLQALEAICQIEDEAARNAAIERYRREVLERQAARGFASNDMPGEGPKRARKFLEWLAGRKGKTTQCAICLGDVEDSKNASACPHDVRHCFHTLCVRESLKQSSCENKCPLCKRPWYYAF